MTALSDCSGWYLSPVSRVDGSVDVAGVAPELLQKAPGLEAMHPCQAVKAGAEHM